MDSSSHQNQNQNHHHQNWLGFSLSNNSNNSLFPFHDSFNTTHDGGEDGSGATDLSMLSCGSPKLEDFLGGCGNSGGSASTEVCQFSTGNQTTHVVCDPTDDQLYDSELKTIAATFLRGFSDEQRQAKTQLVVAPPLEPPSKKAVDTFGQRTSIYRGVTRHRWTGRYEAHLWDNSCRREGQSRKGRQVYLGGYDKEDKAARAYDLAALKYWGPTTTTNFPVCNYEKELEDMKNMTRQEFVASLRRKSSGFSRGASIYRGVTRHHQHGRWQARIGRVAGNKDLYLGTFSTQEEAAEAYDIAAIKFRGLNAVTNFDMSRYDVKSIANSNLPVGGMTNKSKTSPDQSGSDNKSMDGGGKSDDLSTSSSVAFASQPSTSTLSFALQPIKQDPSDYWSMLAYNQHNSSLSNNTTNPMYNTSSAGFLQGTTSFSMDFSACSTVNGTNHNIDNNNNNVGFSGGNYFQQQSNGGTSSSMPFATPIPFNNNNNTGYCEGGGSGNFGNWIAPSIHHSFQPAKANLSMFQTPIFGME